MLTYSVIDVRTRTYLGTVEGETHAICMQRAKEKFENKERRVHAYPSPPPCVPPEHSSTVAVPIINAKSVPHVVPKPAEEEGLGAELIEGDWIYPTRRIQDLLEGYNHKEGLVLSQLQAESILLEWVYTKLRQFFPGGVTPPDLRVGIAVTRTTSTNFPKVSVHIGPAYELDQRGIHWENYVFNSRQYQDFFKKL